MSHTPVPLGGLRSLESDEVIGIDSAIKAADCYLENSVIEPRSAYRDATNTKAGVSGDSVQHLGRFRPSASSARTVFVVGGGVNVITDPSSNLLSDGVITGVATPFAGTAKISGVQLGSNYYLATDESGVAARRMLSDYTLETIDSIPQGAQPTAAVTGPAFSKYRVDSATISHTASSGASVQTGTSGIPSTWYAIMDNAGTGDPAVGEYVDFKLAAAQDWTGCNWVLFAVTPETSDHGDCKVTIQVAVDSSGSPGTFYDVGTVYDGPPFGGSPNAAFFNIVTLDATTRAAVRWVRFKVSGADAGRFGVYGHCQLPAPQIPNPAEYQVDFYNPTTGQRSPLTTDLKVQVTSQVVPSYEDCFMNRGSFTNTGGKDDPMSPANPHVWNKQFNVSKETPTTEEVGGIVTVSGTVPAGITGTVTVRLWKLTTNGGLRLANSVTGKSSGNSYALVDTNALTILSNQLYVGGGVLPRASALGAFGGRLIAGYLNRVYVSSFTPTSDNTNPIPQFPDIPTDESDGYSYDLAPGKDEQIVAIQGSPADAVYILTNLGAYVQPDITVGVPIPIFNRGAVGQYAYCFAENLFFWGGYDGVYVARNRMNVEEFTRKVRRTYRDFLDPDCRLCIGYCIPERALMVVQDNRYMRYCFASEPGVWTTGTLANNVRQILTWVDP